MKFTQNHSLSKSHPSQSNKYYRIYTNTLSLSSTIVLKRDSLPLTTYTLQFSMTLPPLKAMILTSGLDIQMRSMVLQHLPKTQVSIPEPRSIWDMTPILFGFDLERIQQKLSLIRGVMTCNFFLSHVMQYGVGQKTRETLNPLVDQYSIYPESCQNWRKILFDL